MAAAKKAVKRPAAKKAAAKSPELKAALTAIASAMPARKRLRVEGEEGSIGQASTYFTNVDERTDLKFVSTGCAVFNAALGGGWVLGRVANIVGDKGAGKTLLAIEAIANFHRQYPKGYIRYAEAEAAFDQKYAEALGLPPGKVDFASGDRAVSTVEDFFKDITASLEAHKKVPMLYVLDSLDALSDDAEAERDIDKGSFGANKAKKMGELFRRLVQVMEHQDALLIVISQLRDKIGVTFGETKTRSGGRALDFYASHIVWLSETGKLKRTIDGVERVTGVSVRARVKKNKVGLPFRECAYPILFGYGVDDLTANVEWLIEVKAQHRLEELGLSTAGYKVRLPALRNRGGVEVAELRRKLDAVVWDEWQRIETGFMPKSRKY